MINPRHNTIDVTSAVCQVLIEARASLETTLRLHRHQTGALVKLAKYLHQRTGGMIGSLSHLIRAADISAIRDGSERITETALRDIRIDHNSESDSPPEPCKAAG
ncbi:hypothetical protein [Streptomyces mutabilis]|uniref:hypothetical protein n=1 Tax=Streptomyces mutabilis TaxID=67332 RepID=UPI00368B3BBB